MGKRDLDESQELVTETSSTPEREPVKTNGKRTTLVSGAIYHNFEDSPLFKGIYQGECRNEDGKVIGYFFTNSDGEEEVIPNNHAIEKGLNTITDKGAVKDLGVMLEITFLGKTTLKSTGKPYSRFQIVMLG